MVRIKWFSIVENVYCVLKNKIKTYSIDFVNSYIIQNSKGQIHNVTKLLFAVGRKLDGRTN